jgi:hypothetical protein
MDRTSRLTVLLAIAVVVEALLVAVLLAQLGVIDF